jgi:hypothetical protein
MEVTGGFCGSADCKGLRGKVGLRQTVGGAEFGEGKDAMSGLAKFTGNYSMLVLFVKW